MSTARRRLRRSRTSRFQRFVQDVSRHTPVVWLTGALVLLWLLFAAGLYFVESRVGSSPITSFGEALYWGVAAFSTAGIADTPVSGLGKVIGGLWIVTGSIIFFGAIVATVTAYFMRPLQRPHRHIIDTIEYNLEQLDELSIEELDLLRATVDTLIEHMESLQAGR